ncbi:hypothetical protein ACFY7C_37165 [Streptomyces sp. NPDC012769]|uniref:hypothetical protein n=1 Tax=Streptomyces sp. NPDC012769 TaxID=3364848 RepID=UPI0036AA590D
MLHISRDNVYKTIEAATALRAVFAARRVSEIFDTPPNIERGQEPTPPRPASRHSRAVINSHRARRLRALAATCAVLASRTRGQLRRTRRRRWERLYPDRLLPPAS